MKKVVVGISGGVDSSVAVLLLKQQGYEVIGITFIFTDNFDSNEAVKVCENLGIEHHIIDYRKEFKETVINSFINDYNRGITPNPCVLCNKEVKINFLYQKMLEYSCDYMATGHYAKIIGGKLYKSEDLSKDQTYFLAQLSEEQLSKLLLPLEGITKERVREIAKENNLINADKKDSTDVCFITSNFKDYMDNVINNVEGDIIDIATNKVIGRHTGLSKYTIGQRKGLNIGGASDRLFVVGKNMENNILYVALGDNNEYLYSTSCILTNVNFNCSVRPSECRAKFRYRSNDILVELNYLDDDKIEVKYDRTKGVTPGQICVFYIDDMCIGGGVIDTVKKNDEKLWYLL